MAKEYIGESKTVLEYLGFLTTEYQMKFVFQSFDEYLGFCGPINTYSFYNSHGCFTIHQVTQKGEWGWYVSKSVHSNLYDLLETNLKQSEYIKISTFSHKKHLRLLADIIRNQIEDSQQFFGIAVDGQR